MAPGMGAVDDYLAAVPGDRRQALDRLRAECRSRLAGFDESLEYRMPSYVRDGEVELAFASQARYISIYVLREDVLDAHRDRLGSASCGKSCVRYTKPDRIEWDTVCAVLDATAAARGPVR
jgi:uncharacterized protein YdhG (YjbR/CyaY superfamily)